jgi:hypothetical protein
MKLAHSFSVIKTFEQCPKKYYHLRVVKDVKDEGGDASKYGERVHKSFEDRLRSGTPLPKELTKFESTCAALLRKAEFGELFVEHKITLTNSLELTDWFAPDAWLRGILDVMVIVGDKAVILDWKTGKRRPDTTQLEMFAALVFKVFPQVNTVSAGFVWLQDEATDSYTFTRDQTNKLWAGIIGRIRRIYDAVDEDVWPAKPSGLCRYCPAKHLCQYANL